MVKLTAIHSEGPVKARELGKGFGGVLWIVQPKDFDTLIEHINKHGGPTFWEVTPTEDTPAPFLP